MAIVRACDCCGGYFKVSPSETYIQSIFRKVHGKDGVRNPGSPYDICPRCLDVLLPRLKKSSEKY